VTIGDYEDETKSSEAFVSAINLSHWIVHAEVPGWLPVMGHREDHNGVRIDFVLEPTQQLKQAGWSFGFVGIECKRSLTKLGPVIAQASDYASAMWRLPCGNVVATNFVCIWRCPSVAGNLLSCMISRRVGEADLTYAGNYKNQLLLRWGAIIAYRDCGKDFPPQIAKQLLGGNKKGSRNNRRCCSNKDAA
jgi:hypothetical protein